MVENIVIMNAFLEKLGIVALIVLAYRIVRHSSPAMIWTGPAVGILFSIGSVLTMLDPVILRPGVILDSRTVMIGLAALFGGVGATVIVSCATILARLFLGGVGTVPGIAAIFLSALIGLAYARFSGNRRDIPGLALLGLLVTMSYVTLIVLPSNYMHAVLDVAPIVFIRNILGTVIIGYLLAIEDRQECEFLTFKRQAQRDPMTGLSNRRALNLFSARLEASAKAENSVFSVILFDIDHFKLVNDIYGHPVGDQVLAQVCSTISGRMRQTDIVVRYGGEEICVVVPESRKHNAARVAEDIRAQIASDVYNCDGSKVSVTVSAGVAQSDGSNQTIKDVIKRADEALYTAKQAGRNRVSVYGYDTDI